MDSWGNQQVSSVVATFPRTPSIIGSVVHISDVLDKAPALLIVATHRAAHARPYFRH